MLDLTHVIAKKIPVVDCHDIFAVGLGNRLKISPLKTWEQENKLLCMYTVQRNELCVALNPVVQAIFS